ncbi:putative Mg(2+) transport ATPase [Anatilimnocola aggregata]|uniref:Putative Mg(2+) transport ATPase n=1 Tax=Anatilimnocola aggregata TaxID=2528021 RepID=A0A517Y4Q4_9BACT|nr:MgtC/SapB family protein [Anatilimnocola aggregata]QDU25229.1 putative Mg(2+) transport ATPase [Anatilimnocola aggregata]
MLSTLELIVRLSLAALFGAVLGWEREAQQKPAGLRTHILVSLGSAAFMLAGLELKNELVEKNQANSADILKVLGGIVGGIGFLGAGSIIQKRRGVSGLTTAATIWLTAAVGIASGLGYYRLAIISVILALVVLLALGIVQHGKQYLHNDDSPSDPPKDDARNEKPARG